MGSAAPFPLPASNDSASSDTKIITDMRGLEVVIPKDPMRVAILDKGHILQTMVAMGVQDSLVATGGLLSIGDNNSTDRDTFFLYPELLELPDWGYPLGGFNLETLAATNPDVASTGLSLHGPSLLESCFRIHPGTAPQVHISGTAPLPPGGHPIIVGPAALLAALDLLHGPDGEVLQPGPILEGLCFRPSRSASSCSALALGPAWGRTLAWMGDKIWKPQVKKVGVEKLE